MLVGRVRLSFVRRGGSAWHEIEADKAGGVSVIGVYTSELRPLVGAMLRTVAGSLPSELREPARLLIAYLEGGTQKTPEA
jgi:hypothetical protein